MRNEDTFLLRACEPYKLRLNTNMKALQLSSQRLWVSMGFVLHWCSLLHASELTEPKMLVAVPLRSDNNPSSENNSKDLSQPNAGFP